MLLRRFFGLGVVALSVCECSGYVVLPPQPKIISSGDASALVRLAPGERPSKNSPACPASATVYHYEKETGNYSKVLKFNLRNPVAPDLLLVTNGGRFIVTFDDWAPHIGVGPNVLVVYDSRGEVLKSWSLEDIYTAKEIAEFGVFDNSPARRWRGNIVRIFYETDSGPHVYIPFPNSPRLELMLKLDLKTMTLQKFQPEIKPVARTHQP